jgi:replicative DNA helicase
MADEIASWAGRAGPPRETFNTGDGRLKELGVGPGSITVFGAPPGKGKTALVMQLLVDALRNHPDLRAVVWSERPRRELTQRQVARLSGVPHDALRKHEGRGDPGDRLAGAHATLGRVGDRVDFAARAEHDLPRLAKGVRGRGARVMVVDYLQILSPGGAAALDQRGRVEAVLDGLRDLADEGVAVVAVAALAKAAWARPTLASFRDSAEIGQAADDAYLIEYRDGEPTATLHRVKHRDSAGGRIVLDFNGPTARFTDTGRGVRP